MAIAIVLAIGFGLALMVWTAFVAFPQAARVLGRCARVHCLSPISRRPEVACTPAREE
jgi:hypothetical protein